MTAVASKSKTGVWKDPQVVYEFPDGHKIIYLNCQEDLTTLGNVMCHCAGSQKVWALEEKVWYFLAVVNETWKPLNTIHLKQASWMNKRHPRDGQPGTGPIRTCSAYDHQITNDNYRDTFEGRYGCRLPNNGNIPQGVDKDAWDTFVRAYKALADNYKKNVGGIKTVGRRVKFDGKYCIVLSDGIYGVRSDHVKKYVGEWLNSLGKKKESNGN